MSRLKKKIHPRPDIDERLVRPFREMEDVLSLLKFTEYFVHLKAGMNED